MTLRERFFSRIVFSTEGCWLWNGHVDKAGYGTFKPFHKSPPKRAHRVAYELWVGPIPAGHHLHHMCHITRCVRPDHLKPLTPGAHLLEGDTFQARNAAATHCPKGHPYDERNTYVYKDGHRRCRKCRRQKAAVWEAAHPERNSEIHRAARRRYEERKRLAHA